MVGDFHLGKWSQLPCRFAQHYTNRSFRVGCFSFCSKSLSRGLLAGEKGEFAEAALWFANAAQLTPHDPIRTQINSLRTRNWLRSSVSPLANYDVPGGFSRRFDPQPNGNLLLTLNVNGMNLYDTIKRQDVPWVGSISNIKDADWSPDGKSLALGLTSEEVQVRRCVDGRILLSFKLDQAIESIRFSPDGRRIAVSGTAVDGSTVEIWDVTSQAKRENQWLHPKRVYGLVFNRKGDRLATACDDNFVRLFAVERDSKVTSPIFPPVEHQVNRVISLGYRPLPVFCDSDRKMVTCSNGFPHWWDANSGADVSPNYNVAFDNFALRLNVSPDGQWIAAAGDRACLITDTNGKSFTLKHPQHIIDVAFDPNNRQVITTAMDHKARVWMLSPSERPAYTIPQLATFRRCVFAKDGSYIAIGGFTSSNTVWSRPNLDAVVAYAGGTSAFFRMRPGFDGKSAVAAIRHQGIALWDLTTAKPVAPIIHLTNNPNYSVQNLAVVGDRVLAGSYERPIIDLGSFLAPTDESLDSMKLRSELIAFQKLSLGEVSTIELSDWNEKWEIYSSTHASSPSPISNVARPTVPLVNEASIELELANLTNEISKAPESIPAYFARGLYLSRLGRWNESAIDFSKARDIDRSQRYQWLWTATSLLMADDKIAFKQHCSEMVEQFRDTNQADVADIVCKVGLLIPNALKYEDLPIKRLLDSTSEREWEHFRIYFTACSSLVSYRQQNYPKAIEFAKETGESGPPGVLAMLLHAMSLHQLGALDEARSRLNHAEAIIPAELKTLGTKNWNGPLPVSNEVVSFDWIVAEIIRREADSLIRPVK